MAWASIFCLMLVAVVLLAFSLSLSARPVERHPTPQQAAHLYWSAPNDLASAAPAKSS
jgi:hypothetical protein